MTPSYRWNLNTYKEKSRTMTNFIFKSHGTFKKISNQLDIIQSELRHQRVDNAYIIRQLSTLINAGNLQKQVDDFYETSPQTESEEHADSE